MTKMYQFGQYDSLLTELHKEDQRCSKKYLKITPDPFQEIVGESTPSLQKQSMREPLHIGLKLAVTLRFLTIPFQVCSTASGLKQVPFTSFKSLSDIDCQKSLTLGCLGIPVVTSTPLWPVLLFFSFFIIFPILVLMILQCFLYQKPVTGGSSWSPTGCSWPHLLSSSTKGFLFRTPVSASTAAWQHRPPSMTVSGFSVDPAVSPE